MLFKVFYLYLKKKRMKKRILCIIITFLFIFLNYTFRILILTFKKSSSNQVGVLRELKHIASGRKRN